MLGTRNFIVCLISTFFTLILFINVVYAFNLTNSLGVPVVFQNDNDDYSKYYFGITNLINSYQNYFDNNPLLQLSRDLMSWIYDTMNNLSIENLTGYTAQWGTGSLLDDILEILYVIVNIFVNVPYTLMVVIYFLLFLIYVIIIIFTFISYVFYLINGASRSALPNTYNLITCFLGKIPHIV